MRFSIFLVVLGILMSFCGQQESTAVNNDRSSVKLPDTLAAYSPTIDTPTLGIRFKPTQDYQTDRQKLQTVKTILKKTPDSLKSRVWEDFLLNDIVSHWYGTEWDFNGYTDVPKSGKIACGYFVSTTLKHAGVNINRYKLAQQNPLNEAKTLAIGDSVEIYSCAPDSLQKIFKSQKAEGLYFVGLDNHVGYLLFRNGELYFIHSSYIDATGVTLEKALFSPAFGYSSEFRITPLSTSAKFLNKWLKSEVFTVVTGN